MVIEERKEIIGGTFEEYTQMNKSFLEKEFVRINSVEFEKFCKKMWEEAFE